MNRKFQALMVILIAVLLAAMVPFALASEEHTHNYTDYVTTVPSTCSTAGYDVYKCDQCDKTENRPLPKDPNNHPSTEWRTIKKPRCDESLSEAERKGLEEERCTECKALINSRETTKSHEQGEYRLVTPATCDSTGEEKAYCKDCNKEMGTRKLSKLQHKWQWTTIVDPTCSQPGEKRAVCVQPGCAETIEAPDPKCIIKALGKGQSKGHNFGEWRDPETGDGVSASEYCKKKVRVCKDCGRVEIANRDKPKHVAKTTKSKDEKNTYTWFLRTKPSMQGPGRAVQYCKYCGKVMKSKEIKFEGGRYNIPVTGFGPKAASVNASLAGSSDRLIPVDFTNTEPQVFGLVTNDGVLVGQIHLRVMDDTVSVSYTMNDMETVVSQAVFFLYSDAASLTAADLTDMTKAHQFGETVPLNGATFGVLAARLVVNYNSENAANRPFSESGLYLDGVTNNATILQEMTANLLGQ